LSTKIFWLPICFRQNEKKFNLYNLPKICGNKKFPNYWNVFKHQGKKCSRILHNAQLIWAAWKNPKFPQGAQTFSIVCKASQM
jgi:hypothetical protein